MTRAPKPSPNALKFSFTTASPPNCLENAVSRVEELSLRNDASRARPLQIGLWSVIYAPMLLETGVERFRVGSSPDSPVQQD